MWVTKLLIFPIEIRICCPKTTKFGPKLAFLVNLGQAMQAYSQDTYLLYLVTDNGRQLLDSGPIKKTDDTDNRNKHQHWIRWLCNGIHPQYWMNIRIDIFHIDIMNKSNTGEDCFAMGFLLRHEIDTTIVSHHCIRRPGLGSGDTRNVQKVSKVSIH